MRDAAKLATGLAARHVSAARLLPWLLLASALYGEWVWTRSACEMFRYVPTAAWQIASGGAFGLWCIANFLGVFLAIGDPHFRGSAWWRNMWRKGKDVQFWEPVLWVTLAPIVAAGTLVELLLRVGSVRIRRGR